MNFAYSRENISKWPCKTLDQIYLLQEVIGRGRYGKVYKAQNRFYPEKFVAIKKLKPFGSEGISMISLRELRLLQTLKHQNIIRLIDIMIRDNKPRVVYMVFELMTHDLAGILHSKVLFTEGEVKYIVVEILKGMLFCHSKNVVHRDLKSENVLISEKGDIKLADFGLAKFLNKKFNTNKKKVVSLWFRSPELLLGVNNYSLEIDVWSLGCLFVELFFNGEILFKGKNEVEVFRKIIEICGENVLKEWEKSLTLAGNYEEKIGDNERLFRNILLHGKKKKGGVRAYLIEKHPKVKEDILRFIEGFFELNPIKRITVSEALNHDFLTKQPTPTFFYMKYKIEKNCYIYNIRQRKMENLEKKEKEKNKEYNPWDQAMNKILNIYDPDKNIDCFLESIIGKKKSLDIENKKLVKKIKKE